MMTCKKTNELASHKGRGRGYRWEGMEGEGLQVREGMMEGL